MGQLYPMIQKNNMYLVFATTCTTTLAVRTDLAKTYCVVCSMGTKAKSAYPDTERILGTQWTRLTCIQFPTMLSAIA